MPFKISATSSGSNVEPPHKACLISVTSQSRRLVSSQLPRKALEIGLMAASNFSSDTGYTLMLVGRTCNSGNILPKSSLSSVVTNYHSLDKTQMNLIWGGPSKEALGLDIPPS